MLLAASRIASIAWAGKVSSATVAAGPTSISTGAVPSMRSDCSTNASQPRERMSSTIERTSLSKCWSARDAGRASASVRIAGSDQS
jgi:hypothetical protein